MHWGIGSVNAHRSPAVPGEYYRRDIAGTSCASPEGFLTDTLSKSRASCQVAVWWGFLECRCLILAEPFLSLQNLFLLENGIIIYNPEKDWSERGERGREEQRTVLWLSASFIHRAENQGSTISYICLIWQARRRLKPLQGYREKNP